MYSYKQGTPLKIPPIDDPLIDGFEKKLDEILEKYLYKYIEYYENPKSLKNPKY